MFNLAATLYGEDKYAEALQVLDRFIAESKADKPAVFSLRGGLLMSLERDADAWGLYSGQMALQPDDRSLLVKAVAAYQFKAQFDQDDELLATSLDTDQVSEHNG